MSSVPTLPDVHNKASVAFDRVVALEKRVAELEQKIRDLLEKQPSL